MNLKLKTRNRKMMCKEINELFNENLDSLAAQGPVEHSPVQNDYTFDMLADPIDELETKFLLRVTAEAFAKQKEDIARYEKDQINAVKRFAREQVAKLENRFDLEF